MEKCVLPIIVEKDKEGYFVYCSALQGCYTQGDTYEEAIENIKDAIRLHIEDIIESGEKIYKNERDRGITIPYHSGKVLHPKVVKSILRDADISVEELRRLLKK